MKKEIGAISAFIILILCLMVGTAYFFSISAQSNETKYKYTNQQYPQILNGEGNKTQIIHLNKGKVVFEIKISEEDTHIYLTDVYGNFITDLDYTGIGTYYVYTSIVDTDAYILNIRSKGVWEISYR